jgi:hypothetical protein
MMATGRNVRTIRNRSRTGRRSPGRPHKNAVTHNVETKSYWINLKRRKKECNINRISERETVRIVMD